MWTWGDQTGTYVLSDNPLYEQAQCAQSDVQMDAAAAQFGMTTGGAYAVAGANRSLIQAQRMLARAGRGHALRGWCHNGQHTTSCLAFAPFRPSSGMPDTNSLSRDRHLDFWGLCSGRGRCRCGNGVSGLAHCQTLLLQTTAPATKCNACACAYRRREDDGRLNVRRQDDRVACYKSWCVCRLSFGARGAESRTMSKPTISFPSDVVRGALGIDFYGDEISPWDKQNSPRILGESAEQPLTEGRCHACIEEKLTWRCGFLGKIIVIPVLIEDVDM